MATAPAASFSNAVNRIVLRVACTEGHEDSPVKQRSSRSSGEGPLTQQELSDLSLLCLNTADSFASVELELLVALLQLLTQHIDHAVQVDVIGEALAVIQATESPSQAAAALEKVGSAWICVRFLACFSLSGRLLTLFHSYISLSQHPNYLDALVAAFHGLFSSSGRLGSPRSSCCLGTHCFYSRYRPTRRQ